MPRTKVTARQFLGGTSKKKPGPKPSQGKPFKPRRYRAGTVTLRQIRRCQTSTDLLIPKIPFQLLVKEIIQRECSERHIVSKKIQSTALLALQCAVEHYVTDLFCKSQLAAVHGKRVTVIPDDMRLVLNFRGDELKFNKPKDYFEEIMKDTLDEIHGRRTYYPCLACVTPDPRLTKHINTEK